MRGLILLESFWISQWQKSCFETEDEEVQHRSSQFDSSWHWSGSFINPAFTCLSEAPISQLSGCNYKGAARRWRRAKKPGACHEDAVLVVNSEKVFDSIINLWLKTKQKADTCGEFGTQTGYLVEMCQQEEVKVDVGAHLKDESTFEIVFHVNFNLSILN